MPRGYADTPGNGPTQSRLTNAVLLGPWKIFIRLVLCIVAWKKYLGARVIVAVCEQRRGTRGDVRTAPSLSCIFLSDPYARREEKRASLLRAVSHGDRSCIARQLHKTVSLLGYKGLTNDAYMQLCKTKLYPFQ